MKKHLLILVALVMASGLALGAQSLKDNPSFQKSLELNAMAAQAFDDGDYDAAAEYAAQAKEYAALSDQYVEKILARSMAEKAIVRANEGLSAAAKRGWKIFYPGPYGVAADTLKEADAAFFEEDYPTASDKARAALDAVDAIAMADAEAAIAAAKDALANAEGIEAPANYPKEYSEATSALSDALAAYDSGDYPSAAARARACVAALAMVQSKPKAQWPAIYIVRLIPSRSDCLWRIAEYPFIYNNPLKWPVIYEANKKSFRDPGNPNLIFPGQKLKIPSIADEAREGTYDPTTTYPPFPKK